MAEETNLREEHRIIGKILSQYPELTELTQEELRVWNEWLSKPENSKIFQLITENKESDFSRFLQMKSETMAGRQKLDAILADRAEVKKIGWWNKWQTYVAAASIIAAVIFIGLKWFDAGDKAKPGETPTVVKIMNDAEPGKFKAKLTLADGSVVVLDSISNKQLVQQGGTTVYTKDGQLVYQSNEKQKGEVLFHTLTTAKGETYGTTLSDGSKIWLNSQSTLRYPVNFDGDIRKVEVTGEAYFEISKSVTASGAKRSFVASVNGVDVEVLGTHFNINGYGDEGAIKTTLLEGKVRVVRGNSTVLLRPNEQAVAAPDSPLTIDHSPDVDAAVAWHYGYFQFAGADLQTVLRQLVRWYDVEVEYRGNVPQRSFRGKILRNNKLSHVLETLETNNVHFKLEGKKIVVSP